MKNQDIKKLICLGLCIVIFAGISFAVPDFWNYDLAYKNEKLDMQLPNEVEDDVKNTNFTLPVLYVYSYELDKLVPYWEWSADGPALPLREESRVDLYVFNRGLNNLDDIPSHIYYDEMMKLRGRTSSYMQEKKPFLLEFRNDDGLPVNYDFMDFDAESDFVFHAPYIDRSLVRNFMAYTLQGQVTDWAPRCQFAEVFIDTPDSTLSMRDYQGVYLIVEKIKQDKNRIAMGKYKTPDNNDNVFYSGGNIIFKLDTYEPGYDDAIRLETNAFGNSYSVSYPKAEDVDETAVKAISDEINLYESALYEGSDEEFAQYYDIEQIARVVLLTEYLKNYEGFGSSLYFYRPRGEKIKIVQWDYDIGTGNVDYDENLDNAREFSVLEQEAILPYLAHENFRTALAQQWKIMRSEGGVLSDENVLALMAEAETQLEGAWQRNDSLYANIFVKPPFANKANGLANSSEEREYIKEFLLERGRWLDEHINEITDIQ